MTPGTVAYFPEAAYYGPQTSGEDSLTVVLQFGGASGSGYMSADQLIESVAELKKTGEFNKGVYTRLLPDGRKKNMDGYQASWEYINQRPMVYPERRYQDPVFMNPESYSWIAQPTRKHPFQQPFAFALIQLDGADTAIAHAVQAPGPEAMSVGMRVRAQYRDERKSAITDVYFVPEAGARDSFVPAGEGEVAITDHLISLIYEEPLNAARERYAKGLLAGQFIGQKSPKSGKVFVPSSGYDPLERVLMTENDDVVLPNAGTVVGYTVITPVQYYGQKETEPYIRASVLLDGADTPLGQQDIRDIPVAEFRVGLRVRAQFRPPAERDVDELTNRWAGTGSCIERWVPTGEPDVAAERLKGGMF